MSLKKKLFIGAGIAVVIIVAILMMGDPESGQSDVMTFKTARGDLVIDVIEAANIEAQESLEIRSKVEGRTTIISIVDEGTVVTDQDIEEKKILIELDSSELRERTEQQEITVQGEEASYTDARESYEIQKNQNESNLKKGELKVKFARMDLAKYLGDEAANLFTESQLFLSELVEHESLDGEARQKKREKENSIYFAEEEELRAKDTLDWTTKLEAKGYVTRNDLLADRLAFDRKKVDSEKSKTAYKLFKKYEFPKEAEQLRSDHEEAIKELERIKAKNRAEISKAEAKLRSSEARFKRQKDILKKNYEQIENCTIVATKPGLIVYGGKHRNPWRQETIEEGIEIRERQVILNIPNTNSMLAKTKIHESVVARIKIGQKAKITIDALPDLMFTGTVKNVAVLPDSQHWLNPNLKVYTTEIDLDGSNLDLKPGMSAEARIIIDELRDVLYVPLQTVSTQGNNHICFVKTSSALELRQIEVGDYNDKFIEIKKGLEEGEEVVLNITALVEEHKPTIEKLMEEAASGLDKKEISSENDSTTKKTSDEDRSEQSLSEDSSTTSTEVAKQADTKPEEVVKESGQNSRGETGNREGRRDRGTRGEHGARRNR